MSIFSETIKKAISDYRLLLRRYLAQADRMTKLQKLGLKSPAIYQTDISLYNVASKIIADIEENMLDDGNQGYYSYSGVAQFCEHLKEYLSKYEVEGEQVVHRGRKASRILLNAIQLLATPKEQLNENISKQLLECNRIVVDFGSSEQFSLYTEALQRQQAEIPGFYTRIIAHVESLASSKNMGKSEAAA